jgi:hypothetical protein
VEKKIGSAVLSVERPRNFLVRYNLSFFPRRRLPPSLPFRPPPFFNPPGRRSWRERGDASRRQPRGPASPIRAPSRSGNSSIYPFLFTPGGRARLFRLFLDPAIWGVRRALDSAAGDPAPLCG